MKNRQNIFLWALYDFANSFIFITFFLYFSQWIIADRNMPDLWFNLCFAISSLALLFTAPFIGIKLDKKWRNIHGLRLTTFAIIFFYTLTALSALKNYDILALIFFTVGVYFFALSFTFYNPLLNIISLPEKRGAVSGFGIAGNFLGNISALVLAMPFAAGKINLFSGTGRTETLLPAIAAFFVFSLPMLLFFKEPEKETFDISPSESRSESCFSKTKKLFQEPDLLMFLVAFAFFNGAIITIANNFPIILEKVWNTPDTVKTLILLAMTTASIIGSITAGHMTDRWNGKRILIGIIIGWVFIVPLSAIMLDFTYYIVTAIIAGFLIGANISVSRAVMSMLVPNEHRNLGFSYFNIMERASTLIGPIVWGLVVSGFVSFGSARYRIALVSMAILISLSLPFLTKIKFTRSVVSVSRLI